MALTLMLHISWITMMFTLCPLSTLMDFFILMKGYVTVTPYHFISILLPPSAVQVIESVPFVCASVRTLTTEPKGQGHEVKNCDFQTFGLRLQCNSQYSLWCDIMTLVMCISVSIHQGKRTFGQKECT